MIAEILVRQRSFFVLVVAAQEICVQPHDFSQASVVVLVHAQGLGVKVVLLYILLYFIVGLEFFEMCECFRSASELVVNLEFATDFGEIL
jgi:hypothetical protein